MRGQSTRRCRTFCSAFLLASTLLAVPAWAQGRPPTDMPPADAPPPATVPASGEPLGPVSSVPGAAGPGAAAPNVGNVGSAKDAENGGLGEIIVTARRVEENLQTTPISVSVFSPQNLQQLGVTTLSQLQNFTPNLTISEANGGNASIFIRGVGQNDFIISQDPGVGTYIDGVYIARQFGGLLDTLDLDHVEVLRGPQGTLFGRNTEGGAINLLTARPRFDQTSAFVDFAYGTRNRVDAQAQLNLPLTDVLAARVSVSSRTQDGYIHNFYTGQDVGNTDRQTVRISLLAKPTDRLSLFLSGDYFRQRERGTQNNLVDIGYHPNTPGAFDARFGLYNQYVAAPQGTPFVDNEWVSGPRTSNSAGSSDDSNVDNYGVNFTATYDLGDAEIKSITAYRGVKAAGSSDNDATPAAAWENPYVSHQHQFSEEVQLTGTAFDKRLHYTGGLYYFTEKGRDYEVAGFPFGLYSALYKLPDYSVPAPGYAGLDCPSFMPPPGGPPKGTFCWGGSAPDTVASEIGAFLPGPYDTRRRTDNTSLAAYGQASYDLTRQLSLTLGGRISYDRKRGHYDDLFPDITPGVDRITVADGRQHWTIPTWLVTLGYQATPDIYTYGTFSRGYKAGGINTRPIPGSTQLNTYDPEYNTNYEVGVKSELLDHHLRLNGDVYYDQYKKIQFFNLAFDPVTGGFNSLIVNPADAAIYGGELEASWLITGRFSLDGNVAYKHFRYHNIRADAPTTVKLGFLPNLQPNTTFNIGANYKLPINANNAINTRINVSWREHSIVTQVLDEFQNPFVIQNPSFALVTLDVTYRHLPNNLELYLHVDNLFNRSYLLAYANNVGLESELYNRPREWRVGIRAHF